MLTTLRRVADHPRGRLRRRGPDAGITLAELLVTMSLMLLVGTLAMGWLIGSSRAGDRTTDSGIAAGSARATVTAWTKMLQVAAAPSPSAANARHLAVTATSISFDAQLDAKADNCADTRCTDGTVTSVKLELVTTGAHAGQLLQTLVRNGVTKQSVVVPSGASAGSCLFTLYTATGNRLQTVTSGQTVPLCSGLSTTDLDSVARIDFSFVVTPRTGSARTWGTSVSLPGSYRS